MGINLGSMFFSVGADTRDYQSKMAQVDATARNVADSASSSLRRIAETATGFLVAQAIPAVINGFKGMASEAFNAYGNYERLSLSLATLAERDLMEAATLERTTVVGQRRIELTEQEREKLEDLMRQRDLYGAQMQEETERHRQLVAAWGEEGLAVKTHAAKMAQLQDRYDDTAAAIQNLEGKQGQYVDIVKRTTEVVLGEAEAKRRSAKIAQELLAWQQQLNINSPFDEEGVQQAMRTAAAYGFVTEQALAAAVETGKLTQGQADAQVSLQRLVQATTDYAAGTGRTTKEVELISLALGQVKAKGKLAGQEVLQLLQLTNAGVNVRKVLAEAFGVTTAELVRMQEQGLIPADKAIQAIVESFEKDFGGAAKEQTRTWQGLTSTLGDLKKIGLREFFTGTFKAIQPYVADFVEKLANPETLKRLREIGDALGEKVGGALERIKGVFMSFQMGGVPGLLLALGVDIETVKTLQELGSGIETFFARLKAAFDNDGLLGALAWVGGTIENLVPEVLGRLQARAAEWGQQVREWVSSLWANVKDWWATGGGELVTGTIEKLGDWLSNVIRSIGQMGENTRGGIFEAIGRLWHGLVDWWNDGGGQIVTETLTALGNALTEIGAALWKVGGNLLSEVANYARDVWSGLATWWQTGGQQLAVDTLAAIGQWLRGLFDTLVAEAPGWFQAIDEWVTKIFTQIVDSIAASYPTWAEKGGQLLGEFLGKALDFLFNTLPELVAKLVAWLSGLFGGGDATAESNPIGEAASRLGTAILEGVQRGLASFWEALYENAPEQVQKAMDWIEGIIQGAKDGIEWLKALPEKGKALVDGLLSGIGAKATAALTTVASFVTTNIQGAVDWAKFLWDTGKALVDGLIKGINDQAERIKTWIVEWAKRVIPQPLWQFFGIQSPSLLMMEIGRDLVAGLIAGIQNASPELVEQVSTTIGNMMSAIASAFDVIGQLDRYVGVQALEQKAAALIADIQTIIAGFMGLAGQFQGVAGDNLRRMGEALEPLSSVFGALSAVTQTMNDLARTALPATAARSVEAMISLLTAYVPRIVTALSGLAADRAALTNVAMVGEVIETVSGGIRSLVEAVQAIASVAGVRVEDASQRLIWMAAGLLDLINWLREHLGPDVLRELSDSAQQIVNALSPWQTASAAVQAIADVAGVRIETASQRLIWMTEGLITWVNWLQTYLADGVLEQTAESAVAIVQALSPWTAAAEAIQAIADVAGVRIEAASQRLIWMVHGLVTWSDWLIRYLPAGMLEQVAAKAEMIVKALTPWRAAADAVQAIDDAGGARPTTHEDPAKRLMFLTEKLIEWANWLIEYLPTGVLEQVAAKATMIVNALAPWRAVADAIAAIDETGGARPTTHEEPAKRLMFLTNALIGWTDWLLTYLPAGMLERVAAQADLIVRALSPWKAVVTAVTALNAEIETSDIDEKAGLLADMAGQLIMALESMVNRIGRETLEKAALVGQKLLQVLLPWEKAIRLAAEMRAWRLMPDLEERFSRFARQWVNIVADLAEAVAELDEEGLKQIQAFSDTLGKLVTGLSNALQLALGMPTQWINPPSWDAFTGWVQQAFLDFYNWITGWGAGDNDIVPSFDEGELDLVSKVAETMASLMTGLKAALDVALALPATWNVDPAVWDAFTAWVQGVFMTFYDWVNANLVAPPPSENNPDPGDPTTSMGLMQTFGAALSSLMGGLQAALNLAVNIPTSWVIDPTVWDAFTAWVQRVFLAFYDWVNSTLAVAGQTEGGEPGDPTTGMGLVQTFGAALSSLMSGLSSALQLALGFPEAASMPAGEVWDNFKGWVMLVFEQFQTWVVETFHPEKPDEFAPVASFGSAMQAVFGGLVSALEFFQGIVGWVGQGSTFQQRLSTFLEEVKARFVEIADFVAQELDADVLASVGDFGDVLRRLTDGLIAALDFFVQVADTNPAAYTASHEFRVRVQTLLRSIHEVMAAFQEYVLSEDAALWVPTADSLLDAFDRMVGVLRDALNLFMDLQASNLPTPNELQTLIGLVIQLFQNLTGAMLGAGEGAADGVEAIEGSLDDGLGVVAGYVPQFFDAGVNLATAFANGIWANEWMVTEAATDIAEAALQAIQQALDIHSPSRESARMGDFFVSGFVGALEAGRASVDTAMAGLVGPGVAWAQDGIEIDSRRHIVVELRGQAAGGVPLPRSQFDELKRELIWEIQRGA